MDSQRDPFSAPNNGAARNSNEQPPPQQQPPAQAQKQQNSTSVHSGFGVAGRAQQQSQGFFVEPQAQEQQAYAQQNNNEVGFGVAPNHGGDFGMTPHTQQPQGQGQQNSTSVPVPSNNHAGFGMAGHAHHQQPQGFGLEPHAHAQLREHQHQTSSGVAPQMQMQTQQPTPPPPPSNNGASVLAPSNSKKRRQSNDSESMEIDSSRDPSHRRKAVVANKWKIRSAMAMSTATSTDADAPEEHTDMLRQSNAADVQEHAATPIRKKFKSTLSASQPSSPAPSCSSRGSSVAPSPGRALLCGGEMYSFYTNEKLLRIIHSKWPRKGKTGRIKENGLSRVNFPGSKSANNHLYHLEFYHKDQQGGWKNRNELPILVTREKLEELDLVHNDFVPSLQDNSWCVSLLYGEARKPIIPNALECGRDQTSDGTGITHMAQRALDAHIVASVSEDPGPLARFLSDSFANTSNASQVRVVHHEISRLLLAPHPVQQHLPFATGAPGQSAGTPGTGTPGQGPGDLSQILVQAMSPVMEKMQSMQESAQQHSVNMFDKQHQSFQKALMSQQNANKEALTETVDQLVGEMAAQRETNRETVDQLVGEMAAQRETYDAASARDHQERLLLHQERQQLQQQQQVQQQQQQQQQSSQTNHIPASPGFQQQQIAPHLAASAPPLPGLQSPTAVYSQPVIPTAHATSTQRSSVEPQQQSVSESSGNLFSRVFSWGARPAASAMAQAQPPSDRAAHTFQEGQRVLYQQSQSRQIPAIIIKVYKDDGLGGPPYYDIKYLSPRDIPESVQEQERAIWSKQTVGDRLSPMEGP